MAGNSRLPDIALTVDVKRPGVEFMRMVIARRGKSHAAISRSGPEVAEDITIEEVATVPSCAHCLNASWCSAIEGVALSNRRRCRR